MRSSSFALALTVGLLTVPLSTGTATAGTASAGSAMTDSAASCYRQVGDHWECVTPGAFCPAAAHGRYGHSQDGDTYRCVQDGSYWRWKPAAAAAPPATHTAAKCSRRFLPLPDPKCQPGARNPAVTQATIKKTICTSGYTARVRPAASYTKAMLVKQLAEYGYPDRRTSRYEEDFLIPLLLGGAPKSTKNLWPEPRYKAGGMTAANKNAVELKLYRAVCSGKVRLAAAQKAIAKDWRTAPAVVGLT
ncbi:hypothetical protein JOL79_14000 [Microbispora sp. RL4-1S]|uniref:Secreted protein n=1 Tax=Microbispora oryzae TaxID=2806554 RepID=A0A940WFZ2_9ACTN|nr:hypothetical protein [Microbispora oryzae]MBP2704929.1 hypothetical protein [Microbispora oryzae]